MTHSKVKKVQSVLSLTNEQKKRTKIIYRAGPQTLICNKAK